MKQQPEINLEGTISKFILEDSKRYAWGRKIVYNKKKPTRENLRQEVMIARILGEMSAAERVIATMVANPEWDRSDLECAIHEFVVNCNNTAASLMGTNQLIDIEDVLQAHDYYNKKGE